MSTSTVFISYRREDSAGHAGRLFDRLAVRLGRDHVFRDVDNIRPGEDFTDVIRRKIQASDVLFVLIGPRWLMVVDAEGRRRLDDTSDVVRLEIEMGLEGKKRVIPVLLPGAAMPKAKDLPETLAPLVRLNAYEITETHFDQDVLKLIAETKSPARLSRLLSVRPAFLVMTSLVLATAIAMPLLFWVHPSTLMTPEQARNQLAHMGLTYDSDSFVNAAGNGDAAAVSLFLRAGMKPDDHTPGTSSALDVALDGGHFQVARALIEAGANVNQSSPLVAQNGNEETFKLLLAKKPNQEALAGALYQAAESGHIKLVQELLDKGVSPNARWEGNLALSGAAYGGRTEIVKLLLGRGADVQAVDLGSGGNGETALHYAARGGAAEVVGLLLSAGASVNAQDKQGKTALMDGFPHREITLMLLESGANVNLREDSGETALMYAAGQHLTGLIKLIVDKGADINAQDKHGWTSLMHTSGAIDSVDDPETVQAVLDNGADPNKQDNEGYTALMYASAKGLNGTVRVLLGAGADRNKRNKEGKTALQLATASSEKHIAEMLKK